MLKVNAGVCGRVRIVKQNSITGETTADIEFNNIWTDFGINRISTYATEVAYWPDRIHWGSGARPEPHNAVTSLAAPVGSGSVFFSSGAMDIVTSGNLCTITKTRSVTQSARGVAWELSELGVSYGSSSLDTYALVRDLNGDPDPLPVSAIEIITIYYTIQAQYPISLPPQAVEVEGLPPTTATFLLRPDRSDFGNSGMAAIGSTSATFTFSGYTTAEFGGVVYCSNDGTENVWDINTMNRTTEYFGRHSYGASHIWTLDPPITKDNTQELRLEIFWQFANASPVE